MTDKTREALAELVALEDLKKSLAQANHHAAQFPTDENYAVIDSLSKELARRRPLAWDAARSALSAPGPESGQVAAPALRFATSLATSLWEKHYRQVSPNWKPLPDLVGVLTQISNMTSGLTLKEGTEAQEVEPVAHAWQPIETAPKDGTHILLANKSGTSEGGWLTDIDHGADWEGQIGMAGWWRADGTDLPPTHWMPLPAAPGAAISGEAKNG